MKDNSIGFVAPEKQAEYEAWLTERYGEGMRDRSWDKPCAAEAYGHLADVYEHPDFVARYEAIAAGFSRYLPAAMRAWARRYGSVSPQHD